LIGYNIYRGLSEIDEFTKINDELVNKLKYVDRNLEELTTYYYKITALDEMQLESEYSVLISGKTLLGPHAPKINNTPNDFLIFEDKVDYNSIKLYEWFSDINNDVFIRIKFICTNIKASSIKARL